MRNEGLFPEIVTGYGLSEVAGASTLTESADGPHRVATTVGRPVRDLEVRVVDSSGSELAAGEPGEIVVRGRSVFEGYLDDAGATEATFDVDGWMHTGDVGCFDADGYLTVTDRMKDLFIVGGFNAYPAEIEALLMTRGDLAEVAVVGIPDRRLGEVGVAFVVPRSGVTVDCAEVIAWSRQNMSNYKVPRHVEIIEALPRNALMKVIKLDLRDRARDLAG
jgi:acyl-CoA synthetase (AMP-forming)/AMP-acid ligase II